MLHFGVRMVQRMRFEKAGREVVNQLFELLLGPLVLALVQVDAVLLPEQLADRLCLSKIVLHSGSPSPNGFSTDGLAIARFNPAISARYSRRCCVLASSTSALRY